MIQPRFAALLLSVVTAAAVAPASVRAQARGSEIADLPAPGTCAVGYVWRQVDSADHVCVTPAQRNQGAIENAVAGLKNANGTCIAGYVWRQAEPADHVCVTTAQRAQAAAQNREGARHTLSSAASAPRVVGLSGVPKSPGPPAAIPRSVAEMAFEAKMRTLPKAHVTKHLLPLPYDPLTRRAKLRAQMQSKPRFALESGHFAANAAALSIVSTHPEILSRPVAMSADADIARLRLGGHVPGPPPTPSASPGAFARREVVASAIGPAALSTDFGAPVITSAIVDGLQDGPVLQGSTIQLIGQHLGGLSHVTNTPYGAIILMTVGDCSRGHLVPATNFAADGSSVEVDIPAQGQLDAPWVGDKRQAQLTVAYYTVGGVARHLLQFQPMIEAYNGYTGAIAFPPGDYVNNGEGLGFVVGTNTTLGQPIPREAIAPPNGARTSFSGTDTLGSGVHLANGFMLTGFVFSDVSDPPGQTGVVTAPAVGSTSGQALTTTVHFSGSAFGQSPPSNFAVALYSIEYTYSGPFGEPPTDALPKVSC